jgi:hypothetical protein
MKNKIVFSTLFIVFTSNALFAQLNDGNNMFKHRHHHAKKHKTIHHQKSIHRITDPSYQN